MKKKTKLFFMSFYGGNLAPVRDMELTEKQFNQYLKMAKEDFADTYPTKEEQEDMSAETYEETTIKGRTKKTKIVIQEGCMAVEFEKYELIEKGYIYNLEEHTAQDIKINFDFVQK